MEKLSAGLALKVVKENGNVHRCRVNAKKEQWHLSSEHNSNSSQTPPHQQVVAVALFVPQNKSLLPPTILSPSAMASVWHIGASKEGNFSSGQASKVYNKISKASNDRGLPTIGMAFTKVAIMAVAVRDFV
jgi:hypothetical protein